MFTCIYVARALWKVDVCSRSKVFQGGPVIGSGSVLLCNEEAEVFVAAVNSDCSMPLVCCLVPADANIMRRCIGLLGNVVEVLRLASPAKIACTVICTDTVDVVANRTVLWVVIGYECIRNDSVDIHCLFDAVFVQGDTFVAVTVCALFQEPVCLQRPHIATRGRPVIILIPRDRSKVNGCHCVSQVTMESTQTFMATFFKSKKAHYTIGQTWITADSTGNEAYCGWLGLETPIFFCWAMSLYMGKFFGDTVPDDYTSGQTCGCTVSTGNDAYCGW